MSADDACSLRAKRVYDRNRLTVARMVGDVITAWLLDDRIPRICVGDISDAILHLISIAIADKGKYHDIPGASFEAHLGKGAGGGWIGIIASHDGKVVSSMELDLDA